MFGYGISNYIAEARRAYRREHGKIEPVANLERIVMLLSDIHVNLKDNGIEHTFDTHRKQIRIPGEVDISFIPDSHFPTTFVEVGVFPASRAVSDEFGLDENGIGRLDLGDALDLVDYIFW